MLRYKKMDILHRLFLSGETYCREDSLVIDADNLKLVQDKNDEEAVLQVKETAVSSVQVLGWILGRREGTGWGNSKEHLWGS